MVETPLTRETAITLAIYVYYIYGMDGKNVWHQKLSQQQWLYPEPFFDRSTNSTNNSTENKKLIYFSIPYSWHSRSSS